MTEAQVGLPGNEEEMAAFFDVRVDGYEQHMGEHIEDFDAFYDSAIVAIPRTTQVRVLDLGIGTGLELDRLFARLPDAQVTGIDMSRGMLDALAAKKRPWSGQVRTIHGSFLDVDLGNEAYDVVLSVMALHHWIPSVKLDLYRRICRALAPGGVFINADYVATEEESARRRTAYEALGHGDRHTLHIDLPQPIEMERQLLTEAGFASTCVPFERTHCATIVGAISNDADRHPTST